MATCIIELPNEILFSIAKHLEPNDISSLIRTNRRLTTLLTPDFHRIGMQNYQGLPAIYWAIQKGHLSLVRLLLNKGVAVDAPWRSRTPLISAAIAGRRDIVKLLLDRGASINARDDNGNTALIQATIYKNIAICRLLLESGATDDGSELCQGRGVLLVSSALHLAVEMPSFSQSLIELMLKKCSNINDRNSCGRTAIHLVMTHQNYAVVKLLIRYGADLNAQDRNMATALHCAVWDGELVRLLVLGGANMELRNRHGETPLGVAVEFGHRLAVQILLENGADPNAKDGLADDIMNFAGRGGQDGITRMQMLGYLRYLG